MRCKVGAGCGSARLPFIVSTCVSVQGCSCYFADVSKIGQDSAGCSAFYPLCCFALVALLANMALFRVLRAFLAGFGAFVWVCVVLVFAWLVWLLCACGVRRIKGLWRVCLYFIHLCLPFVLFSSSLTCFCPFACPFLSSLLLSSGCPLCLLFLCGLLFSFPYRTKRKKERVSRSLFPVVGLVVIYWNWLSIF